MSSTSSDVPDTGDQNQPEGQKEQAREAPKPAVRPAFNRKHWPYL